VKVYLDLSILKRPLNLCSNSPAGNPGDASAPEKQRATVNGGGMHFRSRPKHYSRLIVNVNKNFLHNQEPKRQKLPILLKIRCLPPRLRAILHTLILNIC
jgi:hypothetical protein